MEHLSPEKAMDNQDPNSWKQLQLRPPRKQPLVKARGRLTSVMFGDSVASMNPTTKLSRLKAIQFGPRMVDAFQEARRQPPRPQVLGRPQLRPLRKVRLQQAQAKLVVRAVLVVLVVRVVLLARLPQPQPPQLQREPALRQRPLKASPKPHPNRRRRQRMKMTTKIGVQPRQHPRNLRKGKAWLIVSEISLIESIVENGFPNFLECYLGGAPPLSVRQQRPPCSVTVTRVSMWVNSGQFQRIDPDGFRRKKNMLDGMMMDDLLLFSGDPRYPLPNNNFEEILWIHPT